MTESGTVWDAPNQQVVRPDESAPWEEGDGGTGQSGPKPGDASGSYDDLSKAELIDLARDRGISPANADMTKAELVAALEAGPQE